MTQGRTNVIFTYWRDGCLCVSFTTLHIQSCIIVALVSVSSRLCLTSICLSFSQSCLCDPWTPQAGLGTLWICMVLMQTSVIALIAGQSCCLKAREGHQQTLVPLGAQFICTQEACQYQLSGVPCQTVSFLAMETLSYSSFPLLLCRLVVIFVVLNLFS